MRFRFWSPRARAKPTQARDAIAELLARQDRQEQKTPDGKTTENPKYAAALHSFEVAQTNYKNMVAGQIKQAIRRDINGYGVDPADGEQWFLLSSKDDIVSLKQTIVPKNAVASDAVLLTIAIGNELSILPDSYEIDGVNMPTLFGRLDTHLKITGADHLPTTILFETARVEDVSPAPIDARALKAFAAHLKEDTDRKILVLSEDTLTTIRDYVNQVVPAAIQIIKTRSVLKPERVVQPHEPPLGGAAL
jgi:hypothetical protein